MGRPPNPLIVDYFRRGPKLKDKSNRYEHSCRKCGIVDKTGRPEKLIDHLVKCSQIDQDQRQEILARHLNQRSLVRNSGEGMSSRSASPPAYAGLEGLAEAARRVSAHEPHRASPILSSVSIPIDPSIGYDNSTFYAPAESLRRTSLSQDTSDAEAPNLPRDPAAASPGIHGCDATVGAPKHTGECQNNAVVSIAIESRSAQHAPQESAVSEAMALCQSVDLPSLESITSQPPIRNPGLQPSHSPAMTKTPVATSLIKSHETPVSHQSNAAANSYESVPTTMMSTAGLFITSATSPATPQLPSPSPTPVTSQSDLAGLTAELSPGSGSVVLDVGGSPKNNRPKRTAKLEPQQRERTAKMRRQGACIRCRLLKKPCSGDDPCLQCQSVQNPRTWRHPCQRVKLHEEITLYSAGIQSALDIRRMQQLGETHVVTSDPIEARIRISYGASESQVSFRAARHRRKDSNDSAVSAEVFTIDTALMAVKQVESKMKRYLKEECTEILNTEQSPILQGTLKLAKRLALDQNDEIVSSTLELWAATSLLTDDLERLRISVEFDRGPDEKQTDMINQSPTDAHKPSRATTVYRGSGNESIDITKDSQTKSYEIIRGQILSAIEAGMADHIRKLLVRLEARLQRPKGSIFETFLACLLLLNCAERMCWLVQRLQTSESAGHSWPLATEQAAQLLQQGETMASVLHMILDMRNVLPKPHAMLDGRVVAPPKASEDVRTWFNEVDLSVEALEMMEARPFVADDMRSMDGRLWTRILVIDVYERLPEVLRPPRTGPRPIAAAVQKL
jgi:hypothetical protein